MRAQAAAGATPRGARRRPLTRARCAVQFAATTQFFLYGKRNFTRTGWERASAKYPKPDALDSATAAGKFYAVTGANSGVGKEARPPPARTRSRGACPDRFLLVFSSLSFLLAGPVPGTCRARACCARAAPTAHRATVRTQVAQYLASKGGTVFMVCRSAGRAQAARDSIVETTKNEAVHVILADVSLEVRAGSERFVCRAMARSS